MQNQSKIRQSIVRSLLALSLAVGTLMPFKVSASDTGPQDGGRTRQAPQVTCTSQSINILGIIVIVTQCSDGSTSIILA